MLIKLFLSIVLLCYFCEHVIAQTDLACASVRPGNFVRNSVSCQAYFYCDGQKAIGGMCPVNLLFSPWTQTCEQPSKVSCIQCSLFGIQQIADPANCQNYYRCVNGMRSHLACADNLIFDPTLGECNVNPTNRPCVNTNACIGFSGYVKIGDPRDCAVFYNCVNGRAFREECAYGLYYNAHIGQCQLPTSNINFCQGGGPLIIPVEIDLDSTAAPTTTRAPTTAATTTTRAPTAAATTTTRAPTTVAGATTTRAPTAATAAGATTTRAPTTATTRAPTTATTRATTTKAP